MPGMAARFCATCATRLARDNTGDQCASCQRARKPRVSTPPQVPDSFWSTDRMRAALRTRHMGAIVRAFRTHPHHGHAISQEVAAGWFSLTQSQLSRVENGPVVNDLAKLAHWARVLGIPEDALWFLLPRPRGQSPRREPPMQVPAPGTLPALAAEAPRLVDAGYVQELRGTVQQLVALEARVGGAELAGVAVRVFRAADRRIAAGGYDERLTCDLHAAVAEVAELAGWQLYDANRQDAARRLNQEALFYARLAGDRDMERLVLQNMSTQAVHLGRPREGLTLAHAAVEGQRLSPRVRTLFHIREARALGAGGDSAGALAAFSRARSMFFDGMADDDPAWAWWVDEPEVTCHFGDLLGDLGDWKAAIEPFQLAVAGTPTGRPRNRFIYLSLLLRAQVRAGAWRDAEATLREVLPYVPEVGSLRTTAMLEKLAPDITSQAAPSSLREAGRELAARLAEI